MKRHVHSPEHRHAFDVLITRLSTSTQRGAEELRSKLMRCDDGSSYQRKYCRSPSCPGCCDRFIAKERKKLEARYWNVPHQDLGSVSIVIGVTAPDDIDDIGNIWKKFKRSFQSHIGSRKAASPAWNDVEVSLYLEVDCAHVADMALKLDEKQIQINQFRTIPSDAEGTVWIVTAHGIIYTGPNVSVDEVVASLPKRFAQVDGQVEITSFWEEDEVHANVNRVVNYALKRVPEETVVEGHTATWDSKQIEDYALWTHGFSQSFKSLKMKIGGRSPCFPGDPEEEVEGETFGYNPTYCITGDTPVSTRSNRSAGADKYTDNDSDMEDNMLGFLDWMDGQDKEFLVETPTTATPRSMVSTTTVAAAVPATNVETPTPLARKRAQTFGDLWNSTPITLRPSPSPRRITMREVFAAGV